MTLKEQIEEILKENKIPKTELYRFAGVNNKYLHNSKIRPSLLHSTICLVAEKKGINLKAILNIKQ